MKEKRLRYRFRKAFDWLFKTETLLEDIKQNQYLIDRRKFLEQIKSLKRLLEDYRRDLRSETEHNKMLSMFIESKLRNPPKRTYVCKHCGFRGKEYRDFCPGCNKDDTGKNQTDYFNISKK